MSEIKRERSLHNEKKVRTINVSNNLFTKIFKDFYILNMNKYSYLKLEKYNYRFQTENSYETKVFKTTAKTEEKDKENENLSKRCFDKVWKAAVLCRTGVRAREKILLTALGAAADG